MIDSKIKKSDIDGAMYFPFCPGIAWSIQNGICRVRKGSISLLNNKLQNNDITILAYGGLLETFASLYIMESININFPSSKLFWEGNSYYNKIIEANGLANISMEVIGINSSYQYPLPLFFDKEGKAYINALYNYAANRGLGLKGNLKTGISPFAKIIYNSLYRFNSRFLPKFRDLHCPDTLSKLLALQKININKFTVLLIPDKTGLSIHDNEYFKWDVTKIKSFYAALKQDDIQLIIATNEPGKYYSFPSVVPLNIENIIYLLNKSNAILSRDYDYLVVSYMMGAPPIAEKKKKAYALYRHADSFRGLCRFYEKKNLQPINAINFIRKLKNEV
jgi:hypothetical protein